MIAQALFDEVADGTVVLSETETEILQFDKGMQFLYGLSAKTTNTFLHILDEAFLPITLMPFAGDREALRVRSTLAARGSVKVNVHDGFALRPISISPSDSLREILEKTSNAMRRPGHTVEIGYEASWSSKIGNKRSAAYISNKAELNAFWTAYDRYVKVQQTKKGNSRKDIECNVLFQNMLDRPTLVSIIFIELDPHHTLIALTEFCQHYQAIQCQGSSKGKAPAD